LMISIGLLIVIGANSAIMAFTPVVLFYCLVGLQTNEKISKAQLIEYFFFTIIALGINFIGR